MDFKEFLNDYDISGFSKRISKAIFVSTELFVLLICILLSSCDRKQKEPESREAFGAICTVNLYESGTERLYESIFKRLDEISSNKIEGEIPKEKKGYAAKEIRDILEKEGVQGATINLGENIYAYGKKKDNSPWKIGIKNPMNPEGTAAASITGLTNVAIVTSGIYSQNLPKGASIKNGLQILSMTVISTDPILAENLSAKLFMMGTDKAFTFLESVNNDRLSGDIMIVAIQSDGKIHASKKLKGCLGTILDDYSVIFR